MAQVVALHRACRRGHTAFVSLLLKHVHRSDVIDKKEKEGNAPLRLACSYLHKEIAVRLIKAEDQCDIWNGEGVGMLHQAAVVGNVEQVRFMLDMCGLNLPCSKQRSINNAQPKL
ncbi:ankyrin repeat-containing domain protein [Terfezia claveryi]|nr:ankyrin repeat-containing domain protein [Terfezia claveryi]